MSVPTNNIANEKKKLSNLYLLPLVLLIIASIMLLVSGVFATLSYLKINKVKQPAGQTKPGPELSAAKNYTLYGMLVIWAGFIASLVLLAMNYLNYSKVTKEAEPKGISPAFVWGSLVITSLFALIGGVLILLATLKNKKFSESAYTNSLVSTVTSIGGFFFVVFSSLAFGFTDNNRKKIYNYLKSSSSNSGGNPNIDNSENKKLIELDNK